MAIASLWLPNDGSGLDCPRSCLGIERIGLAASPPRLTVVAVGALDFDDGQPTRTEPARQPGAIAPGSLDPDLLNRPELTCPR